MNLDLININLSVLLSHLLISGLHCIKGGHGIPQIISRYGRGFHIERLLRQLSYLFLVEPFLPNCPQSTLLNCILSSGMRH